MPLRRGYEYTAGLQPPVSTLSRCLGCVPGLRLEQGLPSLGVSLGNELQRGGLLRLSHVMPIRQPAQPSILLKDDRPKLVQRDSRYGFLRVKAFF